VLPYEEYEILLALLEDQEDLRELRAAKQTEGNAPVVSLAEVKKQFADGNI